MDIKILGTGCPSCRQLEENARQAIADLNLSEVQLEHVSDINKIIEYGVMSAPAIVIDNQVKAAGRIAAVEEIKNWLK